MDIYEYARTDIFMCIFIYVQSTQMQQWYFATSSLVLLYIHRDYIDY